MKVEGSKLDLKTVEKDWGPQIKSYRKSLKRCFGELSCGSLQPRPATFLESHNHWKKHLPPGRPVNPKPIFSGVGEVQQKQMAGYVTFGWFVGGFLSQYQSRNEQNSTESRFWKLVFHWLGGTPLFQAALYTYTVLYISIQIRSILCIYLI